MALASEPLSDRAIARMTGVPRQTVGRWRRTHCRHHERRRAADESWRPPARRAYAYALGLYLGDGHLVCSKTGSAFLRLALDERYPNLIDEAALALRQVFPGSPVRRYAFGTARRAILQVSDPVLPFAFPQHGRGRKHHRSIQLARWQDHLVAADPRPFLRGLIHSDGCRTTNRVQTRSRDDRVVTYEYTRYFFSNESADIRELFARYCSLLGIHCTQSNARNISVSRRASVAALDSFVGPKS
jgi:hypothetical protein